MNKKDPFGFNKAINYDKLQDPEVLKQLEKILIEETGDKQQATSSPQSHVKKKKKDNYENK
tara:strand:+ start:126 stop:308 length:183 start_codon:yes stop_codon:yes gene_type:complete